MADETGSSRTERSTSTNGFFHIFGDFGSGLESFKISIANLLKTTVAIIFGGQTAGASKIEVFDTDALFNLDNGNSQLMVLDANLTTLAISNEINGGSYIIYLVQDATGGWAIPVPGASFGVKTLNSDEFSLVADGVSLVNVNVAPNGVTYYTIERYEP